MNRMNPVTKQSIKRKIKLVRGKNIVITGASSGIGKELLDRLSAPENHNRIFATSRTIEKLTGYGKNVHLFNLARSIFLLPTPEHPIMRSLTM